MSYIPGEFVGMISTTGLDTYTQMMPADVNAAISSSVLTPSITIPGMVELCNNILFDIFRQSTKSAESGVKSLADGFKGMGLAIKAIGIGLVMEAFNLFKEVLGKNQKVVDGFNTVIGALSIAFNDLFGFVFDNFPTVIKIFKDVFENPTTYLKKFGDLVKENLIERFNSFLDTIGYVGESIKKVFEGDFAGAMESVKKAGKESLDVLTGVNNSFDKGKKIVVDAADAIGNYAIKTLKASEANINLQNSALIAAAEQAKLVEKYDADAEKLRKIRDNDLLSVKDRIKANDDLKKVLENQSNAMKSLAAKQEEAAQATYNLNKSTENHVALINAQGNALGVVAPILAALLAIIILPIPIAFSAIIAAF